MALSSIGQWQLLREIIYESKSGTLTVRFGRSYQHWLMKNGMITQVSSTIPEHSLAGFLRETDLVNHQCLKTAQSLVDDRQSLGFVLAQHGFMKLDEVADALQRHVMSLVFTLLRSSASLFWSDYAAELKPRIVETRLPLDLALLQSERSSIELHPAVRFVEECPGRYRSYDAPGAEPWLSENERRVLDYVKSGTVFEKILRDPELDRLTCYRTIFLLWLTGHLHKENRTAAAIAFPRSAPAWIQRFRDIPPEWIFPFLLGMLLGILAVPRPDPDPPPSQTTTVERWHDTLTQPAWRP